MTMIPFWRGNGIRTVKFTLLLPLYRVLKGEHHAPISCGLQLRPASLWTFQNNLDSGLDAARSIEHKEMLVKGSYDPLCLDVARVRSSRY